MASEGTKDYVMASSSDLESDYPFPSRTVSEVDGRLIISPNCTSIPLPPWGLHEVRARADQRFGHDDFAIWPQFYSTHYEYFAAIPRKPEDSKDPITPIWWDATDEDFIHHPGSTIEGFGRLSEQKYRLFDKIRSKLVNRAKQYITGQDAPPEQLLSTLKLMNHTCVRVGEQSTTLQELQFTIAEFQRYFLEVRAMLDYFEIYEPGYRRCRLEGKAPTNTALTLGAYTSDVSIVLRLYYAGLPVYFIQDRQSSLDMRVLNPVACILPSASLTLHDSAPPHPSVYATAGTEEDSKEKFDHIHRYSRIWMFYDPDSSVRTDGVDLIPNASYKITLQNLMASRSRTIPQAAAREAEPKRTPIQLSKNRRKAAKALPPSAGRDPYSIFDTVFFLKPPSTWSTALGAINQSRGRLLTTFETNPTMKCFALPDPHTIITPASDEKKMAYLLAWLRARPSLIFQARKQLTLTQRSQTWREFLELLGRDTGKNDTSKAAVVRDKIRQIYTFLLSETNFQLASATYKPDLHISWRGIPLSPDKKPAECVQIFREVTWELNEANFRLELLSLDCLASELDLPARQRIQRISKCFQHGDFLPPSLPTANAGMAADNWQKRIPYVLAFVEVLRSWKGSLEILHKLSREQLAGKVSQTFLNDLERDATNFYCQSFFNYFDRAPSLPRQLYHVS